MKKNLGILSVGTYLPPEVRKNDWWPKEIVAEWQAKQARSITRAIESPEDPPTEGMRTTLEAMAMFKSDPFEGAVERRVMPQDMTTYEMETLAARDAIEKAGIDKNEIDLLLTHSNGPHFLMVPNACAVHRDLGLSPRCFSMGTEGMCNAFLQQLALAEHMILSGRMRYGLLIQSCNMTRFTRQQDQHSAWFGDGATAVVVGPVSGDRGVLGHAHSTDGSVYGSIVTGMPGRRWWESDGPVYAYLEDAALARLQFLKIADAASPLVDDALSQAGLGRGDIRFWACHQASAWLGRATQQHLGLVGAHRVDTFSWAGSLSGCNVPLVLSVGEREGLLRDGDVVAMFSGAAGMTVTAVVARWGTG